MFRVMGMRELGELVKQRRMERGFKQAALARAVGVSHTYISKIEKGDGQGLGYEVLRNLSRVLGESFDTFEAVLRDEPIGRAAEPLPEPTREIPVVSDLSAGSDAGGVVDGWEYMALSDMRGRVLRAGRVTGSCMEPEIYPGDVVFYDAAIKTPRNGQLVVATLADDGNERGRGVVKRFSRSGDKVTLTPLVGDAVHYDPDDVRIEGVVVEIRRKVV